MAADDIAADRQPLELCQRLYPSLPGPPATALIDEGNQISRMAHQFMQRLGTSTESPAS